MTRSWQSGWVQMLAAVKQHLRDVPAAKQCAEEEVGRRRHTVPMLTSLVGLCVRGAAIIVCLTMPAPAQVTPTPAPAASTEAAPLSPMQPKALKPKYTFKECANCPEMTVVPAGSFTMGSYRLPTEAEYEYATRAGTQTVYPWGNAVGTNNANCHACGSQWDARQTAPVGSFAANGFGLYDMVGNVRGWTEDCYHERYVGAPADGSAWIAGANCSRRVVRGGSWLIAPTFLRSAYRYWFTTKYRLNYLGFRVARTLAGS